MKNHVFNYVMLVLLLQLSYCCSVLISQVLSLLQSAIFKNIIHMLKVMVLGIYLVCNISKVLPRHSALSKEENRSGSMD